VRFGLSNACDAAQTGHQCEQNLSGPESGMRFQGYRFWIWDTLVHELMDSEYE
jgi:hypothetical protein